MKLSNRGYAKLKLGEACRLTAYLDSKGRWTIGWGHTSPNVVEGLVWTQPQADRALTDDVATAERAVNTGVRPALKQCQFDALVLFTYNVGVSAFANSTMRRFLNEGKPELARLEFHKWNHITVEGKLVESPGLTNRRAMELAVFDSDY